MRKTALGCFGRCSGRWRRRLRPHLYKSLRSGPRLAGPRLAALACCGLLGGGWPAGGPRAAAAAEAAPVASAQLDLDGDGRADGVTVAPDGRVSVRPAAGPPAELRLSLAGPAGGPLRGASVELKTAGAEGRERYLLVRAEPRAGGAVLLVAALSGGAPRLVYDGPIGPVGRDGEYSVLVAATAAGLVRSQAAPGIQRCDGEARLFPARWRWPDGPWQAAPELLLPARDELARLPRLAPAAAPDKEKDKGRAPEATPLGVYRFVAASAAAAVQRADLLAPPRELEDGSAATAWQLQSVPLGAFVTARADGREHALQGLRLTPASPRLGGLPRQLLLLLSPQGGGAPGRDTQRFLVDLPQAARGPLLVPLPQPVPAACVSLVVSDPGERLPVAIGEVALLSELDAGEAALPQLVQALTTGDQIAAEGALRTLLGVLSRPGPPPAALMKSLDEALPQARGAARRRVYELLQGLERRITPGPGQPPPGAPRGEEAAALAAILVKALLGAEDADRPALWTSLLALGEPGAAALRTVAADPARAPVLRSEALQRLGALPAPAATRELLAARELGAPAVQRGFVQGLAQSLRCRPLLDERWRLTEEALGAAWPQAGAAMPPDPQRPLLLLEAVGLAQTGCADPAAGSELAERLGALWARLDPVGAQEPDARFLLRLRLIQALARLGLPAAVAQLQKRLFSGGTEPRAEPELRQAAVRGAAAQVALPESQELLRAALGDPDAGVRIAAATALTEAPAAALQAPLEALIRDDAWPQVRRAAIEARAALCPAAAGRPEAREVPALRRATTDRDEPVRRQALLAVVRCEGPGALAVLTPLLGAPETPPGTRGQACALTARLAGSPSAPAAPAGAAVATALSALLDDPEADERHAAAVSICARALGELGGPAQLGALLAPLATETPAPLRRAALEALTRWCRRGQAAALSARDRKELGTTLQRQAADAALEKIARGAQDACR